MAHVVPRRLGGLQARISALKRRFRCTKRKDRNDSAPSTGSPELDQLFHYNSGRWIYNEREQTRIRYVAFDVDALKRVAAAAVGADHCVELNKIAEGSFNKIFLLTLDNGAKLIAKLPCPLVKPSRLCTASEVATMDYARTVLDLPVPRILKYSADANTSEVGAEYILMEHVQGVELWKRMDNFGREATHLVDQLVDIECKFVRHPFSQIGSLYYKEDVSPELRQRPLYAEGVEDAGSDRFRIGPYVDWDVWRGTRNDLDVDRGPWPDTLSYVKAIVNTEKRWLSEYAVPRSRRDPFRRPGSENDPLAHVRLLDDFLAVISTILPPAALSAPVLWHNDLHASNVFVPAQGSPDILGLIDWQGICVRPLFLQVTFPACVRYQGDERITIPPGMAAPTLPPDFETYSEEDQAYLRDRERRAVVHKYYETRVKQRNPIHVASQTYPHMEHIVPPIYSASRTWFEGMHRLRQALLELDADWAHVGADVPFPVTWDPREVAKHRESYPSRMAYDEGVQALIERLQLEGDGWVTNERYEEVMRLTKDIAGKWNAKQLGGPYPFQDGGRSWFLS